jgi:feruloyl esterase
MKNIVVVLMATLGAAACGSGGSSSTTRPTASTPTACIDLKGRTVGDAVIDNAVVVPASGRIGEYCKVNGNIHGTLKFQVNLPSTWDGARLVQYGGGGWDGVLDLNPDASWASAVSVASNGGNTSTSATPWLDASFALNNAQGQQDFGHLSAHSTLLAAKELVRLRFGRDAQRHYFRGCSNGGREALIAATRWPQDYDGILAVAPGYSFSELMQAFVRNSQAFIEPGAAVNQAKATTIANAVVAACDAADGVADGIVSKPLSCNFDPGTLRCSGGDNDSCLTDAQVAAARVAYSETRDAANQLVYPGWEPGGENLGWPAWITMPPSAPLSSQYLFADGFVKYWLTSDPNFNFLTPGFDVANHPTQMAAFKATVDATPDLRTFFSQNRKLVLSHGMHDWAISYKGSVRYFDQIAGITGPTARDANMEFFLLPGVQHCGGGVGADGIDLFEPLVQWTETGTRPSARDLTARKFGTAGVEFARPLCRYPTFPRYKGTGDVRSASSFSCSAS